MPDLVEALLAPNVTTCTACSGTDNHPKHHYGADRYHWDCIPADVYDDSFGHLKGAERKRVDTLIAHAREDGVEHLHGHALRLKHIELNPEIRAGLKARVDAGHFDTQGATEIGKLIGKGARRG